jgi:hypothetical protein
VVKKFVRWFNERFLGVVYYEMVVCNYTKSEFRIIAFDYSGEVKTEMHTHFEYAPNEVVLETKMKRIINTFEGTPIDKIKFVKKYV